MSIGREKRLGKLLEVEHGRVAAEEKKVAAARTALAAEDANVARAEGALEAALVIAMVVPNRGTSVPTAADLADASAHQEALRIRVRLAKARAAEARADVAAKERALVAARVGERRIEILIESSLRIEKAHRARVERRAADEHAARARSQA